MAKKKKNTTVKEVQELETPALPEEKDNSAIVTGSKYVGAVSFKLKDKNDNIKIIKSSHNEGTVNLSKLFAMLMSGYPVALNYIPKFLDLQYSDNGGEAWFSYLKTEVPLTAPSYYFDTSISPSNWVAAYTAVIAYSSMRDKVDPKTSQIFRFVLKTDRISEAVIPRDLAYFYNISAEELSNIEDGTQAIIEWKMQLVHDREVE